MLLMLLLLWPSGRSVAPSLGRLAAWLLPRHTTQGKAFFV